MPIKVLNLFKDALKKGKDTCARFEPKTSFGEDLHESNLSHIIGGYLEKKEGYWVILEAWCKEYEKGRCDLYWRDSEKNDIESWCEIKKGWHGNGEEWNTKPRDQLVTWINDIVKLINIKDANRYFILLHYRQNKYTYSFDDHDSNSSSTALKIVNSLRLGKVYQRHIPLGIPMQSAINILCFILKQVSKEVTPIIDFDLTGENDLLIYRLYCGKIEI